MANSFAETEAHKLLLQEAQALSNVHLTELFARNADRFKKFSISNEGLLFDYSKHLISEDGMKWLLQIAEELNLSDAIEDQFTGKKINQTEGRAVLHTALRSPESEPILFDGEDISIVIHKELKRLKVFSEKVITGEWKGFTGKPIENIVNIGIGGSDLGPKMVCRALQAYHNHLNVQFISNVDGAHAEFVLKNCDPETTLFIIASKTFSTQETMANAELAKAWFLNSSAGQNDIPSHFVAVSSQIDRVSAFGIDPENMFVFWDWVGGRFSLWSAIGLPIILALGFSNFSKMLEGAHQMDEHFRKSEFKSNIPVLMALIGIWQNNYLNANSLAVLPYSQDLEYFSAYLQQAEMESNGKYVSRQGKEVNYNTCPVIWGEPGTNGQHAFYQLLHQGTRNIACDFIAFIRSKDSHEENHELLLSNFLAQSKALMEGKKSEEVYKDLAQAGLKQEEINQLIAHKTFKGNRSSSSLLFQELTPFHLGRLIALYEHKIFVQGVLWNVYSYDQWGVELGKVLANQIIDFMRDRPSESQLDASTNGLMEAIREGL